MTKPLLLIVLAVTLAGCADRVAYDALAQMEPVGFWHGFWHGLIIAVSFVASLFMDDVAIYAAYNNGGWYDSGFMLGLIVIFSSSPWGAKNYAR